MLYDTNTSPQVILNVVSHTHTIFGFLHELTGKQAGERLAQALYIHDGKTNYK